MFLFFYDLEYLYLRTLITYDYVIIIKIQLTKQILILILFVMIYSQ